jgi:hypothetical protein
VNPVSLPQASPIPAHPHSRRCDADTAHPNSHAVKRMQHKFQLDVWLHRKKTKRGIVHPFQLVQWPSLKQSPAGTSLVSRPTLQNPLVAYTIPTSGLSAAFDGQPPNPARIHPPLVWLDESTQARRRRVQPRFWASARCAPRAARVILPVPPKAIALWRLRFQLPYSCRQDIAKLPAKQVFSLGLGAWPPIS